MSVRMAGFGSTIGRAALVAGLLATPAAAQEPGPAPAAPLAPVASPAPAPAAEAAAGPGEQGIQALEAFRDRYIEMGGAYRKDVESLLRREILRRRQAIDTAYEREAGSLEKVLRDRRNEAIQALERFLARYPDNREYTPEVMFRLAELYYDQAQDDYQRANPEYEEQHKLWERGRIADEPKEPVKDYDKSIRMYRALVQRFPDYPANDAARYALGYCLADMGERDQALAAFRDLIEKHPQSRWVPEAWLLVGEHWFDAGKYRESIEAYNNALTQPDSRYYDMALYKLAWSYFQLYDYPTAINTFKKLIERVDAQKGKSGIGKLLRQEAVEYLGISLADDDWNGDGEKDPDANVGRALSFMSDGKPFEREILEKYGDTLYAQHEMAKYPMAIDAYRAVIAKDPMNPGNAVVKEKIIGVYDVMRDREKMTAERQDMVASFGPGSAWHEANKGRPEVIARVDRQLELALSQAAQFHHQRAQELKAQAAATRDPNFGAAAVQEYKAAATAYSEYLKRFPDTKHAYENAYNYAECLYYSFDYQNSVRVYQKVRDWPGKTTFIEPAAYSVILGIEKEAAKRVQDGTLVAADVPGEVGEVAEEKAPEGVEGRVKVQPLPVPPLTQDWIKAVDFYIEKNLSPASSPERAPKLEYRVAGELYKRRHLEDARRRFEVILTKYPQSVVASNAAMLIINSFRLENDWDNITLWSKKIDELKVGRPEERAALAAEVKVFQLGAQFKDAEKAFEAGDYKKAAESFLAVVDADPKMKAADKALQNAAASYQKLKYYDSAAKVYQKLVTDYPDSQYVEGALYQLAENARKFMDFDRAVQTYQSLRQRFPKSEQAPYALYQTAVLLEAQGRLREAATTYERFADAYPKDPEAGAVVFKAGVLSEKQGNRDEAVRLYKRFVRDYGGQAAMNERVIEAMSRTGDIFRGQGQMREWESVARQILKEFAARGLKPDTPVAAYPARAQFQLIEDKFKAYEAIRFVGDLRAQGRLIQQKKQMLGELEEDYKLVLPYKSVDWTSAAVYRLALIYELFAKALFTAQVPKMTEEQEDIYRTQIEDAAKGYQDTAQERYAKLIEEARRLKTANEWTRKAVEAMNKYRPAEFPLMKEERRSTDTQVRPGFDFEDAL